MTTVKYENDDLEECSIELDVNDRYSAEHVAEMIANEEWNRCSEELRDPDDWPRLYRVWWHGYQVAVRVEMEYIPTFTTSTI